MSEKFSIKSCLSFATSKFASDEAAFEAQLLLQHVLKVNRAWLIAHENDALQANIHAAFEGFLQRRLKGEPIAYILGYREFYGLKLKTTADTLIPRPDTETLVEAALAKVPTQNAQTPSFPRRRENEHIKTNTGSSFEERPSMLNLNPKMDSRFRGNDEISNSSENTQALRILDLGTGTGAIALAIAKSRPNAQVTAVDFSENALKIARENAQSLNITNVEFIQSNWFSALSHQKFDLIVSNPPYIEENDSHLKQGDLRFEPITALASGADGLDDIRHIISHAKNHLNPHGCLLLEHGYNQAEQVAALLKQSDFGEIETIRDLGGNARVTLGLI